MVADLLQVRDLRVAFPRTGTAAAVDGISFDIRRNRVTAIVGESGSGKSLTALCLNRLTPPGAAVSGRIRFSPADGSPAFDLLGLPGKAMEGMRGRHLSMVFQEPMTSLNPLMTCGGQVAEMLRHHLGMDGHAARTATIDFFDRVQLPDPAGAFHKYPHQLSGGQKQRVMIAMAVCCQPDLLIADEPTTALDVTVQQAILHLLRDLQRSTGMGVLFITHDLGLVEEVADDLLVMFRGRILEQGPVRQVLTSPDHPYTRALLACRPAAHPPGARLPVVSDFLPDAAEADRAAPNPAPAGPGTPPPPTGPLLEVRDLVVSHPDARTGKPTRAVDGVSFDIDTGETVGLVGASGCGKTTLGRALLQLIRPDSGSIRLQGRELTTRSEPELRHLRPRLQIVFQDPYGSLNPTLTIGSTLTEPLRVHGRFTDERQRRNHAARLLTRVGLTPEHLDRYPHEFSGGQRQRIGIARALALDPAFLVFDESVSALDVSVQAQVLNLLADLKRELRFTALFISHDLAVVRHVSDRILVMDQGRIVESGPAETLFREPAHPATRRLLQAVPGRHTPGDPSRK